VNEVALGMARPRAVTPDLRRFLRRHPGPGPAIDPGMTDPRAASRATDTSFSASNEMLGVVSAGGRCTRTLPPTGQEPRFTS
jgi:hypothetical protein